MWACLPSSMFWPFASARETCMNNRWGLGASDILFKQSWHRGFFHLGQVIETHRGAGIFQPAVDEAVKHVQEGGWVRGRDGDMMADG